jgi:hypothetical protein
MIKRNPKRWSLARLCKAGYNNKIINKGWVHMTSEELLRKQIIEKAWADDAFKQKLLTNPKAAIQEAFGVNVPDQIELKAFEESSTEFYLVIPANPSKTDDGGAGSNAAW